MVHFHCSRLMFRPRVWLGMAARLSEGLKPSTDLEQSPPPPPPSIAPHTTTPPKTVRGLAIHNYHAVECYRRFVWPTTCPRATPYHMYAASCEYYRSFSGMPKTASDILSIKKSRGHPTRGRGRGIHTRVRTCSYHCCVFRTLYHNIAALGGPPYVPVLVTFNSA